MRDPRKPLLQATPLTIGALLVGQLALLALFVVDWRIPVVLAAGLASTTVLLDNPVWAVGCMLAARVISTGTMSFFSIGKVQIGLFEPVLLLTLVALLLKAVFAQKALLRKWPWQGAFFAMIAWRVLGLFWCVKFSDGLKEIIGLCVIVATASVVLAFIERWEDVRLMIWAWIGICVVIGLLAQFGGSLGFSDYSSQWKAAESGGRETGLGQQPNWFAMNLMFVVHTCAALGMTQKKWWIKYGLYLATVYIFFTMMSSGSRGGAYSIVIGGGIVALGQPLFRKWFVRFAVIGLFGFMLAYVTDLGGFAKGLNRISGSVDMLFAKDIRGMNWDVCISLFRDTYGLGIGPGGYVDKLKEYNWYIYESVYRYPHGIFWGEMAHTGVVGLVLLGALVVSIIRMALQTIEDTRGTEAEIIAWSMPASLAGYWAWSFVEFNIDEKPHWEWLALYTALHVVARRGKAGTGPPIPPRDPVPA